MIKPYYISPDKQFYLLQGDTFELLPKIDFRFDMIFADPPYFLSNDGLTVKNGKIVSVNKGKWDKSYGFKYINEFNRKWLKAVRRLMKDDATIWISGTAHNIFSVGQILTELDFKILNIITWQKTNPPPNFSRRYFTHSTEQIIWARKHKHVPHYYNYELMKQLNGGKQMKDVWTLPAIAKWEKSCGKHPTQKPLSVLTRIILASTKPGAWILDPFTGSSTTGIAANLANRRFVGIDLDEYFLQISRCRKEEILDEKIARLYRKKISGFKDRYQYSTYLKEESKPEKILLGYVRKKEIPRLTKTNKFYFHAIEHKNKIHELPSGLFDAEYLYLYNKGRGQVPKLTGHFGKIKNIRQVHKSQIPGKVNSRTEFYWEITLEQNFQLDKKMSRPLNLKKMFRHDKKSCHQMKKFYPVVIDKANLVLV